MTVAGNKFDWYKEGGIMMKFYKSLPFRLLPGIVLDLDLVLGLILPENAMVVVVTVK